MKHSLYIVFTIIILAFCGCKKDDVRVQEFKVTSESIYKNTSTIVITVNYTYASVLQSVDGYISESSDMTNALHVHGEINKNNFVLTFNDLHANTTYYYYYEYSNGIDHLTKSEIKVSTTNDYGLPTVITNDVTDITATSAICGGEITDDGESEITARGVCYSLNENPTIDDSHTIDSLGIGSFTSHLIGLNCDTTYYYRAYATNIKGTNYGEQKFFVSMSIITTMDVTDIEPYSALCGGYITEDEGFEITARGVCYSTKPNPTINCSHTTDGTGVGSFTSYLYDLSSYTTYYVRAYATNSNGTKYGEQKVFKTLYVASTPGAINGVFSASATKRICFSKGNLRYNASTNIWSFAENQYIYISSIGNSQIGLPSYIGNIDLFGWGTGNFPTNNSVNYNDYNTFYDWGSNPISNGGNSENMWRTLTRNEWLYIFNERNTTSEMRYAKAIVNDVNGVIILPDDWDISYYTLYYTNTSDVSYSRNIISLSEWRNVFEKYGAVFLPAGGIRTSATIVEGSGSLGEYWSSTMGGSIAYNVEFSNSSFNPSFNHNRNTGLSVRLVCDTE